mmetsp:Transcript_895/g.1360  ORF Transcript_895/g.1360 Transcript_895/m.1360 type:complete len:83 (+) Transcript_895:1102-1350(+)
MDERRRSRADGGSEEGSFSPPADEKEVLKEPKVVKTHIEMQMEKEKTHHWIRKRNGRIYDEKIKNLITTADNGSALLKQEIT